MGDCIGESGARHWAIWVGPTTSDLGVGLLTWMLKAPWAGPFFLIGLGGGWPLDFPTRFAWAQLLMGRAFLYVSGTLLVLSSSRRANGVDCLKS